MIVRAKGSIGVTAGREAVWAALHDVERLSLCVPGCRKVARDGDGSYRVTARVHFGPVRVGFDGVVEVADFEAPARLGLTGRGRGGLAGTATGTAMIRISERAEGCLLSYELAAEPEGPIALLGSTCLTGLAAALSEMFARRFTQLFSADAPRSQAPPLRAKALTRPTIS